MVTIRTSYNNEKDKIRNFLNNFYSEINEEKYFKYATQITKIAHRELTTLRIELTDIEIFDEDLKDSIIGNAKRYVNLFGEVIEDLIPSYKIFEPESRDTLDVYIHHRLLLQQRQDNESENPPSVITSKNVYPRELIRRFEIVFDLYSHNMKFKPISLRQVKASLIGKLIAVTGIVVRNTEVKPLIQVATYTCDLCGAETYQPVGSSQFMPLLMCPSEICQTNKSGGRLSLQTRGSKFIKFQELKIQEHSEQVPVGNVPRWMSVLVKGDVCRLAQTGDHIHLTGVYMPTAVSSSAYFGALSRSSLMSSDTYIEAHHIVKMNKTYMYDDEDNDESHTRFLGEIEILKTLHPTDFYDNLAMSIAPEIYGFLDVKKALLLLLVGGVEKLSEGMKIRGSINICLMGDPGVAKSQLLSFIDRLAPRSQYTTGRGSSGVGLTAAVLRDPVTGEICLEGGSLVLADRGVCCIDEFDKMEETDRVAIHEVMEQQTISIAKAGIMTTLNARTSILAAANPIFGRYNPRKSIQQNIQLPAALLSRFDILWLIRDICDEDNDLKLARHISHVHRCGVEPDLTFKPLDMNFLRRYILYCQTKNPIIPPSLSEFLTAAYVDLRRHARNNKDTSTFTSARTLLAILRMATAIARLRLGDEVYKEDVLEALRLIEKSKESLNTYEHTRNKYHSVKSQIFDIIVGMLPSGSNEEATKSVDYRNVINQCLSKGYTQDQIDEVLEEYTEMNVWQISMNKNQIIFVN